MEKGKKVKTTKKALKDTEKDKTDIVFVDIKTDDIDLNEAYGFSMESLKEGDIVKGKIVKIGKDEVIIDINYKSEGVIPISQFIGRDGKIQVKEGDELKVFLEKMEDKDGAIVLSREKAEYMVTWDKIVESYEAQKTIMGKIVRQIKGGFEVDIGVKAFLPASQLDIRPIQNLDAFIGKVFPMRIIKINKALNNIVLSRRIVLEEEREAKRTEILATLEEGQTREGIVKNITAFGAFIDLGGVDGLLHITDMSWGKTKHPSEKLALGDKIEVKIINYDKEKNKISLGLKQKISDPWEKMEEKYKIGQIVKGKVINMMDYGAFVEIEEGIEGLIHNSEMSWVKRINHPSQIIKLGQITPVAILSIDKDSRRLSLGLKQTQSNPWEKISEKYPSGSKVKCKICNITDFGIFVELEEGIEGLVHISDISWTRKIKHPSEIFKIGDITEAIVLTIDKEKEKISLGVKQLSTDPISVFQEKYKKNDLINVEVVEAGNTGYLIKIGDDLTGILPFSEIGEELNIKDNSELLGKKIDVLIMDIDLSKREIILSQKMFLKGKESKIVDEFNKEQGSVEVTLADAVKKSLKKDRAKKTTTKKAAETGSKSKKGKKDKDDSSREA